MTSQPDKQIQFSRNTKHTRLYEWSLHEASQSGEKLGPDLIPYDWTTRFSATALRLLSELTQRRVYRDGGEDAVETHETEVLVAELAFDGEYSSSSDWSGTELSMFGTDRLIRTARLRIEEVNAEASVEECTVWGCPSYKTEIDFHIRTIPDTIEFHLRVSHARFLELRGLTSAPTTHSLDIYVAGVEGFYSVWSPEIGTDGIKILTATSEHAVKDSEDGITLPRLGKVGEFKLTLTRHAALQPIPAPKRSILDELDSEKPAALEQPEHDQNPSPQELQSELLRLRSTVGALAVPAWILVALLFLIAIF